MSPFKTKLGMAGGGKYVEMMRTELDVDPAILATNSVEGLAKKYPTLRQSTATAQRCKVVNVYISKLQDDIRMLLKVRDSLGSVKIQMEKEKIDTIVAERIAKQSLLAIEDMAQEQVLKKLLDEIIKNDMDESDEADRMRNNMCEDISEIEIEMPVFQPPVQQTAFYDYENLVKGLSAPDIPYFDVETDELLPLED